MSQKLQNYLCTYRKRSSLSQDEVASLLGCESGTKISRYECFDRKPGLEATLACAIVFGVRAVRSLRELGKGRRRDQKPGSAAGPEAKPSYAHSNGDSKA